MPSVLPPHIHLPRDWKLIPLGRVGRFLAGTGFPHEFQGVEGEQFPFFKVADFNSPGNEKELRLSPNSISSRVASKLGARICPPGAIVFPKVGAALLGNKRRTTVCPSVFDNNMMALIPSRGHEVRFLYWALSNLDFGRLSKPGPVPSLNEGDLREIAIPVPAPDRQAVVAAFLDRKTAAIDALIVKKERLIALLQEKRQALITQAVTRGVDPNVLMKNSGVPELGAIPEAWTVGQLGRFMKLQRGIDITGAAEVEVGAPVISSGGFSGRCPRAYASGPGVVLGRKGTLGTVYYVAEDYWPHDTTLWVREFRGSDPKYVFYFLRHMQLERLDSGAANPTLNRNVVHPLKVAWPDIAAQRQISEWLDDRLAVLDRESGALSKSLGILREYRQALISAAVTGKIDIPAEEAA